MKHLQLISFFSDMVNGTQPIEAVTTSGPATLGFFSHGFIDDLIADSVGAEDFAYPLLWLDTPASYTYRDITNRAQQLVQTGFVVLCNAPSADPEAIDSAFADAQAFVERIIAHIKHAWIEEQIMLPETATFTAEPLHHVFVDSNYGWRVEFTFITNNQNLC
jgi:hypothetical protein